MPLRGGVPREGAAMSQTGNRGLEQEGEGGGRSRWYLELVQEEGFRDVRFECFILLLTPESFNFFIKCGQQHQGEGRLNALAIPHA